MVLIVDDNTTNLFVMSSMISKMSVSFEEAHNGEEAVIKFKEGNYRLVLMDINMPIMNGYEASKKIKELQKDKKRKASVVAVSAQDEPIEENVLRECGIVKWMVKPVGIEALKSLLRENGIIEQFNK